MSDKNFKEVSNYSPPYEHGSQCANGAESFADSSENIQEIPNYSLNFEYGTGLPVMLYSHHPHILCIVQSKALLFRTFQGVAFFNIFDHVSSLFLADVKTALILPIK